MRWRERQSIRWLEAELPGARAAFSTRLGGASAGEFASLNLGLLTDDEPTRVRENRRRLGAALELEPRNFLIGLQVHEGEVLQREEPPAPNPYLDAAAAQPPPVDGQATANDRLAPLVFVADCLPLALAGRRGIAMLHCGWRGLGAGIVARGVAEVEAEAAAIGPGIGPCCYEVGDEVRQRFTALGEGVAHGRMLDLPEVAARLLAQAGVESVERARLCTSCEPELFYSHRRARGRTGRQAGVVWRCPS